MKATLYARVSSEKQAEKDLSIASQLKSLRKYALEHDYDIYDEFIDEAESARTDKRPAFQKMIALTKQKPLPFDIILVWKFSRFSRNRNDSIVYKTLLKKRGVSLISINEKIDDSPSGYILEGMIELIDEFYSINLSQDTLRGLKENASRGFNNGAPPYGYRIKKIKDGNTERGKLEPDEFQAPVIKLIFNKYIEGKGIKEIAKDLNLEGIKTSKGNPWCNTAISYLLKNEAYNGTLVYNKKSKNINLNHTKGDIIRVENNHPAIIEKDIFFKVQSILSTRNIKNSHPKEISSIYLLSGLVYCGKCQNKMIGSSAKSGKYFYYACHNYLKRGKDICNTKSINKEKLERMIIDQIKKNIITEKNLKELLNMVLEEYKQNKDSSEVELKNIGTQLGKLQYKRGKLYNVLETGKLDIDDIAPRLKELKSQIDKLEKRKEDILEKIKNPDILPFNLNDLKFYMQDLKELLNLGSIIEQKTFLKTFIKKITVNHPEVKIEYRLPIINKIGRSSTEEVLPMLQTGSPGRIRTYNPPVNSRMLHR